MAVFAPESAFPRAAGRHEPHSAPLSIPGNETAGVPDYIIVDGVRTQLSTTSAPSGGALCDLSDDGRYVVMSLADKLAVWRLGVAGPTRAATSSSAPSTRSNRGAPWPPATTSSPSFTAAAPCWPPSSPGYEERETCRRTYPIPVEIVEDDDLFVMPDRVTVDRGQPVIFLLDTGIRGTAEARKLAAAILECCDRIDATTGDV